MPLEILHRADPFRNVPVTFTLDRMSRQLLLTLIAASIGVVSGLWFAWPAATPSPDSLAWVADPPWDSAEAMASLMMEQACQSFVGGVLLLVAFVFQIAAAVVNPSDKIPVSPDEPQIPVAAALGAVVVTLIIAGLLSSVLYQLRIAAVKHQMSDAARVLKQSPRLTPER